MGEEWESQVAHKIGVDLCTCYAGITLARRFQHLPAFEAIGRQVADPALRDHAKQESKGNSR